MKFDQFCSGRQRVVKQSKLSHEQVDCGVILSVSHSIIAIETNARLSMLLNEPTNDSLARVYGVVCSEQIFQQLLILTLITKHRTTATMNLLYTTIRRVTDSQN